MTVNYMMMAKDGVDLGADYSPFARGSGPTTTAVTDKVRKPTRVNLVNGSFETNLSGWSGYSPSDGMTNIRSTAQAYVGVASQRLATTSNGTGGFTAFGDTQDITVTPGRIYEVRCRVYATIARTANVRINWYTSAGAFISQVTASATATAAAWTEYVATGTAPANAATGVVSVQAINLAASTESVYLDDVWFEEVLDPTITGVPADLAGKLWLYRLDVEAPKQTMVWPSGFYKSVFRAVRDPAVVTDDSGNTLGTQVYNHGWLLAERLAWYFRDMYKPDGTLLQWPPQGSLSVVPVTGSPAVNDGRGWYGLQSVTWPGSGVGVGTLRQLLAGDEGSTRKVAAILDLLKATTSGQRNTIGSSYNTNQTAIMTAYRNLETAAGAPWPYAFAWPWTDPEDPRSAAQNQYAGRESLNTFLGRAAVGLDMQDNSDIGRGVCFAMMAITAKEAGLIAATFTEANYQTMTEPIDAVLAMPSGY